MTNRHLFDIWAPPGGPWSDWAKPVLFAHLDPTFILTEGADPRLVDVSWAPPADGSALIILDLPSAHGVWAALELAHVGYRPVPLYNAIPSRIAQTVCDLLPITTAIVGATSTLDQINVPYAAPPAFMLDSARRIGLGGSVVPGMFDNRSVSLPTDFPSANLLLSRGIHRAILVQADSTRPQEDLAHTLLRWQNAGISVLAVDLLARTQPTPIQVPRPRHFRSLLQRLIATLGLRRNPLGGFGGILPIPTEGSAG